MRLADAAIRIGPSPPAGSYLSIGALIAAAKATGAEAVHPGYGFLAENADFAEACAAAGLVFVGPPPAAIRAMGDKSAAKARMEAAGVPCVPGLSRAGPVAARFAEEGGAHRLSGHGQGERRRRRTRHAHRARARGARGRAAVGPRRGGGRVRRRPPADRARASRRAPCRDAGVRRRARRDRPSRRARLLDPAPPSEADRGSAVAGHRRPRCARRWAQRRSRPAAAVGYVGAGTVEFLLDR